MYVFFAKGHPDPAPVGWSRQEEGGAIAETASQKARACRRASERRRRRSACRSRGEARRIAQLGCPKGRPPPALFLLQQLLILVL